MDVRDVVGDRKTGLETIATRWPPQAIGATTVFTNLGLWAIVFLSPISRRYHPGFAVWAIAVVAHTAFIWYVSVISSAPFLKWYLRVQIVVVAIALAYLLIVVRCFSILDSNIETRGYPTC